MRISDWSSDVCSSDLTPVTDPHRVEVMAAAITDARGRILLARRTAGRDLAGLWEFPGGKREPGETPEHALVRELRERSEERRVGKEGVRTCRSPWSPYP